MSEETTTEQLAEIEGQAEPVQVREGRWRTRGAQEVQVTAMPTDHDDFSPAYPWWDGDVTTWADDGVFFSGQTSTNDLVTYLGPIEPQPEPQAETDADQRIRLLKPASYAQAETILRLQVEKRDLNMEIGGLRRQLAVATEELKTAAAVCKQLQIELDAAQQVPQAIADRFEEGWNQGTARAVETVLAWLEPVRLVDNPNLANEAMQHLPQIMRHLTGLAQD